MALIGFSAVVSLFFALWVASSMTARLEAVAAAVRALASGRYGVRTHVDGRDEVASLAHDINTLADRLQEAESERAALDAQRRELHRRNLARPAHAARKPAGHDRGARRRGGGRPCRGAPLLRDDAARDRPARADDRRAVRAVADRRLGAPPRSPAGAPAGDRGGGRRRDAGADDAGRHHALCPDRARTARALARRRAHRAGDRQPRPQRARAYGGGRERASLSALLDRARSSGSRTTAKASPTRTWSTSGRASIAPSAHVHDATAMPMAPGSG